MADIVCTATGRAFFQVDSTLAAILLEAFPGAFERAGSPQHRAPFVFTKPEPKWALVQNAISGRYAVQMTIGARNEVCDGTAEIAAEAFKRMGFPCPDAILAEYREALQRPTEEQKSVRARRAFEESWNGDRNRATGNGPVKLT